MAVPNKVQVSTEQYLEVIARMRGMILQVHAQWIASGTGRKVENIQRVDDALWDLQQELYDYGQRPK